MIVFDNKKIALALDDLIRRVSTSLPEDVRKALSAAEAMEDSGSPAEDILRQIRHNLLLAEEMQRPVCQDTGTPVFYLTIPQGMSLRALEKSIDQALIRATENGYLRPNAVDALSGKNSGNNTGICFPVVHFQEWDRPEIRIRLMLKGGGSENASMQFSLPHTELKAGRDLAGVRACCLAAVQKIQGQGCAPGILGVCIGGDRQTGMTVAKEQLFRSLEDESPVKELAELEKIILRDANTLGIGPMGLGGKTTLLGVKTVAAHRLPASYFVSVSYMCWACRRGEVTVKND